ncbi:hypothetical protein DFJ58DRAFT_717578 [Suillus subalutaceus]|uniref:uncharacterized protein n=1 Tax=Suillus subalutaceus TaxID=48586 RepID=UPI001B8683E6|nr:uncharacterized protein DFJ58DRAFT_717578 [Suillus subalutaceus]KAG1844796.1 hypothetical protein DFJ58DRAFT_717578 [Suillus subalutaceus]
MIGDRTFEFDEGPLDLFTELKAIIASGEVPFSTPLAPINDERELSDDSTPDFRIELPGTNIKDTVSLDNPTYPWPSKSHFVTSLLFGSPRLPFSDAQKRAVLSWVQELGARDDYGNPLTRFSMQDYPEDSGEGMLQVFNGKKMLLDLPSPPAARVDGMIYFTGELLQDDSGGYFILEHFFHASLPADSSDDDSDPSEQSDDKALYALGRVVEWNEQSPHYIKAGFIVNEQQEIIPTSMFMRSFEEIAATPGELDCGLTPSSVKYASLAPNPLCAKSNGRMVYTVPLLIFMDDVSGNVSKQWNKHHAIYMSNANLPREMLKKDFFVRFVTSSPHAAPMELMRAMKESICNAAESGIIAWDCKYNEEVMLVPYALFLAGDNPMQAEECSHAGLNCNYFSRTCDIGGTKEHKVSGDGYRSLFMSGNLRTPENTTAEIRKQCKIKLRKHAAGTQAMPEAEVAAVLEKEFAELLQGDKLDDTINPLLGMEGLDMHMDTPTEILHTILLGVVKYFWGQTMFLLDKAKLMGIFQVHLESVDKDGLNAPRDTCRGFAHQDIIKHIVTGGYWYDNKVSKWVRGGVQILGYLDEHPEQARLLGLSVFNRNTPVPGSRKAQTSLRTHGKMARNDAVAWKETYCWKILKTAQPGIAYYQGKSLVAREGDVAYLNSHVIFRRAADEQCKDTVQQPMCQERLETSRTKPIVQHKSTPHYFVNAYSIHNYDHINLVIPEMLRESPLRVTNVAEVREIAVQQMKQKKALKKSGDAPQLDDHIEHDTQIPLVAAPTFDQAPPKSKTAAKSKAKAATSRARRKAATSKTGQVIAGSSSQLPSAQQDHQNQAHFALPPVFPPPQYYHPPDHSQLPPPQLYDLPPPALYLHPGSSQRHHEAIERSYTAPVPAPATAPALSSAPTPAAPVLSSAAAAAAAATATATAAVTVPASATATSLNPLLTLRGAALGGGKQCLLLPGSIKALWHLSPTRSVATATAGWRDFDLQPQESTIRKHNMYL